MKTAQIGQQMLSPVCESRQFVCVSVCLSVCDSLQKVSIRSFLSKHTHSPLTTHTTHSKLILSLLTHFTKISDGASVDWLTLINPGQPIFGDDNWTVSKRNRYPLLIILHLPD